MGTRSTIAVWPWRPPAPRPYALDGQWQLGRGPSHAASGRALQSLGSRLESINESPHLAGLHERLAREVAALAVEVKELRRERSENETVLDSVRRRL